MDDFLIAQGLIVGAAAVTGASIIGVGVAACFLPALVPLVPTIVGGLVTIFTVLAGGDAFHKWNIGKNCQPADPKEPPPEPLPPQ